MTAVCHSPSRPSDFRQSDSSPVDLLTRMSEKIDDSFDINCTMRPRFSHSRSELDIEALASVGASIERHEDWMPVIRINSEAALEELRRQADSLDDPGVQAVLPAPGGTQPPLPIALMCITEANSILDQFAPLRRHDFAGGANPPLAPLHIPALPVVFHHASIATTKVLSAISNPGPIMPTIHGLGRGTLFAEIQYVWANCMTVVPVVRM